MLKKILKYSLIGVSSFFIGCGDPGDDGFKEYNLKNNTYLDIDTNYVLGTDVYIKDTYNDSILTYKIENIVEHSIFVNNLKYNLISYALNPDYKCFMYNGVKYFGDEISSPLLYCDLKTEFNDGNTVSEFSSYSFNYIFSDILIPKQTDSFDGFYAEYGDENQMSVVGFPIVLTNSINDTIPEFIEYLNDLEITNEVYMSSSPSFNINGDVVTSEIRIKTNMDIGSMSLLNIISKEIMNKYNINIPNTFLTSSYGRISNTFRLKINFKILKDENGVIISNVLVMGGYTEIPENIYDNLTTEEKINTLNIENSNISNWEDFVSASNLTIIN